MFNFTYSLFTGLLATKCSFSVFLRKEYAGNVTPCRVLVVVKITSFLPSVKGVEFPCCFMRAWSLSCSHSEDRWVSVHCGRQASQHQQSRGLPPHWDELGFQVLDRINGTLLQGGAV
jgi:hypothetical protein